MVRGKKGWGGVRKETKEGIKRETKGVGGKQAKEGSEGKDSKTRGKRRE